MNLKKFFEICEKKGISEAQIIVERSKSTSIRLFKHEIDSFKIADSQSISAFGIYQGKFGSGNTQKFTKDSLEFLADQIILTAKYNEKEEEASIFKGSEKYKKGSVYNKELPTIPLERKIAVLREVENAVYAADPSVTDADHVTYAESEYEEEVQNSFGLKLKQKGNYFTFVAGAVCKKGDEVKTFYDSHLGSDFGAFDPKEFASKIVQGALAKFGGAPCDAGKYPTVLHHDVFSDLIDAFLSACSAEEVQKHSSFLEGKLGEKVASSKLTIEEKPLTKNVHFSYFDGEGVAKKNKVVIQRGVLKTYFHNRETAKKAGVETTGNGTWGSMKVGIGFSNIFVRPGKQTFDELIAPIKDGVFITEVAGLGTGLNPNSGDFSCQAEGFRIRDGKLAEPLNLITLSGNLLKMVKDLKGFDNNPVMRENAISVANAYIKSMSIGGK